jgi:hypothetical protein
MMGNAKIWWYPEPGGIVEEIDIGGPLSDLDDWAVPAVVGARSATGADFAIQPLTDRLVRVTVEEFDDHALYRELKALEGHLQRGGSIALSSDAGKAVAGFLVAPPARGDTSLVLGDTPWSTLAPSAVLAAADEVVIETGQPVVRSEIALLSAVSGVTYTIAGAIHDFVEEPWVLMRHRGFLPSLRLPLEARRRQVLTTRRQVIHTFSAVLEVVPGAYAAFADLGTETVIGDEASDGSRTFDDVVTEGWGTTATVTDTGSGAYGRGGKVV